MIVKKLILDILNKYSMAGCECDGLNRHGNVIENVLLSEEYT